VIDRAASNAPGQPGTAAALRRVVIVRHGETEWSVALRHTGRTDLSLTPAGRRRARALASDLAGSYSIVLSSPLRRARETCELAGFAGPELDQDLQEWDYGEYEGLTTPEIRARRPGWNLWRDGCPGWESASQVGARADLVLARLRAAGGDALVFAHGHMLRVLTARWLGMPPEAGAHFVLAAGSIGVLGFERETEVIERWNCGG
jgi:probable phosphoglycerate mutase